MIEKKNIDRLFQEKFKDFEVEPAEQVWVEIKARLEEKKDRKVIPFWFKLAGVAAALLLGLFIADSILNSIDKGNNTVVIEKNEVQKESDKSNTVFENDNDAVGNKSDAIVNDSSKNGNANNLIESENSASEIRNENNAVVNSDKNQKNSQSILSNDIQSSDNVTVKKIRRNRTEAQVALENSKSKSNGRKLNDGQQNIQNSTQQREQFEKTAVAEVNNSEKNRNQADQSVKIVNPIEDNLRKENTTVVATAPDETILDTTAIATVVPNALEELLKEKEETVTTNEPKLNRWQISSNVAPIYFSSNANGSPLDAKFENNSKDIKSSLAIGVGVRYALSNKFTVRAGVNTIGMEYSTNDLVFTQNPNARTLEHVDANVKGAMLEIDSKGAGSLLAPTADAIPRKFESSLNQRTDYIEVPVELSYKVINKKFGLELIGGVSGLFLSENSVALVSSGIDMEIGKANNLSNTHYSTNIGLGIKYEFFKSFQFNVEPMLKYQINKFTDSNNYKPYFFGLYTGLSYRF